MSRKQEMQSIFIFVTLRTGGSLKQHPGRGTQVWMQALPSSVCARGLLTFCLHLFSKGLYRCGLPPCFYHHCALIFSVLRKVSQACPIGHLQIYQIPMLSILRCCTPQACRNKKAISKIHVFSYIKTLQALAVPSSEVT